MSSERLIYLPLGGAGEIGMNAYVYGYGKPGQERLILVDLGVTFPDMDTTPGVDLILPDIESTRRYQTLQALLNCTRRSLLPSEEVTERDREGWHQEILALQAQGIH